MEDRISWVGYSFLCCFFESRHSFHDNPPSLYGSSLSPFLCVCLCSVNYEINLGTSSSVLTLDIEQDGTNDKWSAEFTSQCKSHVLHECYRYLYACVYKIWGQCRLRVMSGTSCYDWCASN